MRHIILGVLFLLSAQVFSQRLKYEQDLEALKEIVNASSYVGPQIEQMKLIKVNDSVSYSLNEILHAKRIDSLWLNLLYTSNRFEEMYESIQEQAYNTKIDYDALDTELLKERLAALNAKTPFNISYTPQLEQVIKQYLKNRTRGYKRLIGLSKYYFPMFEEILDRHGLPLELKYLAVVESALDPMARSRVGATGLWQFMYQTGKLFGLEVNSYVDDRNDPLLATEAAAKYLSALYDSLEDWDLALAAYNSGPGNVSKAIRRSGGKTNYWSIRQFLPRETANYVPAFLATMYIFEYAEEHGLYEDAPKYPIVVTDTIHVKQQLTLEYIAEVTDLPLEELQFLNPAYKLGVIPKVSNKSYMLRLPIESVGAFVANEDKIYQFIDKQNKEDENIEVERFNEIRYRVKNGDYLGKIANMHGVRVEQIKQWNNLKNNNLRIGQQLIIYPRNSIASKQNTSALQEYIVKSGDSLWSIAKKFPGVSIQNIRDWNGISSNSLKPGMRLKINKS